MDTGSYMANQMDNLIEASQHEYNKYFDNLENEINDFLKESKYSWTAEEIFTEYREKYSKGFYVSHTCKVVIKKFEEKLKLVYGSYHTFNVKKI